MNGTVKHKLYADSHGEVYMSGPTAYATSPSGAALANTNAKAIASSDIISSIVGSSNFAVSAVELSQTLRMLGSPMKSIAQLATSLVGRGTKPERSAMRVWVDRPNNFRRDVGVLDGLSGTTLQFNLGVRPLLNDIYTIAGEYLNMKNYDSGPSKSIVYATAKGYDEVTDSVLSPVNGFSPFSPEPIAKNDRRYRSWCSITAAFGLSAVNMYQMKQRYINLSPSSIAWELVPASFVIDYVYDIGSYLHNNQQIAMYNQYLLYCQYQSLRVTTNMFSDVPYGKHANIASGFYGFSGSGFSRRVSYDRSYPTSLIQNAPVLRSFDEQSKTAWSNVAALMARPFCR